MTFFDYLERTYVKKNLELRALESKEQFSLKLQAEANAAHALIGVQRRYFRVIGYFKLVMGYFAVKLHLSIPPKSPKEQQEALVKAPKIDSKAPGSVSKLVAVPNPSPQSQEATVSQPDVKQGVGTTPTANELED